MSRIAHLSARLEARLTRLWFGKASPSGLEAVVLRTLEWIYSTLRDKTHQTEKAIASRQAVSPPVLVIGNLIAGGAGKTPLVTAVCKHVTQLGLPVGIVTRGYGRHSRELLLLKAGDPVDVAMTGDEAALLHATTGCPIAIGADRQAAAELLREKIPGIRLIVSDDGLQHHKLLRSHEWVAFDQRGAGNHHLLPAGPLREPLARLNSVEFVICTQGDCQSLARQLDLKADSQWVEVQVNILRFVNLSSQATLSIEAAKLQFADQKVLVMTGLGNPDKFFDSAKRVLNKDLPTLALPDHFDYPADFCSGLSADVLVVTAKDAVKLDPLDARIWVAEAEAQLPRTLTQALEDYVGYSTD